MLQIVMQQDRPGQAGTIFGFSLDWRQYIFFSFPLPAGQAAKVDLKQILVAVLLLVHLLKPLPQL